MKMNTLKVALVITVLLGQAGASMAAPYISGPTNCQHVMDLLFQYGHGVSQRAIAVPYGNGLLLGDSIGDLEIMTVVMCHPGDATQGPKIAVTISNNSERAVSSFSISAVAVLGRIRPFSPSVTQTSPTIGPGENVELKLCLPLESLAMGRAGTTDTLAFQKLVIAIDSFDQLLESNESNNIVILDRDKIPVVEQTVVPAPAVPAPQPAEVTPDQQEVAPTPPQQPVVGNSIDNLDFEKLEMQK